MRLQGREGSVTILDGRCEALVHAAPPLIAAGAAKAQRGSARSPPLLVSSSPLLVSSSPAPLPHFPLTFFANPSLLCVCLQVISGSNLPLSRSRKTLDPFVRVEIHGIPFDSCRKSTHAVKNNCKYSLGLEQKKHRVF